MVTRPTTTPPITDPDPDPFDTLLTLEDQYFTEGYNLGTTDGSRAGRIEGRIFGLEKGYEKAIEMGKLNGRAAVWKARMVHQSNAKTGGGNAEVDAVGLKGTERLKKHIERLAELTEFESLETRNEEAAVNEFDERLAGARAKATLIGKIVGEAERSSAGRTMPEGIRATSRGSEEAAVETEVDMTGSGSGSGGGKGGRTTAKRSGEMEDFVGLPQVATKKTAD
ncbi:hypothetical protein B0A50_07506 [Salinomyces thailandicus]|uniref:Essential protein Yae1 N-terminal domain-containing protein n=1 Tax=Salinomyces thailandicus TaxID=706561 RepID=A0A4V5N3F9_9PEZI|nr:hypothetical protein B0A50_07506 [Salinomyces thailandica]